MDLQEKLNTLNKEIDRLNNVIITAKESLKAAKKTFNEYGKLIEKAKALEQK